MLAVASTPQTRRWVNLKCPFCSKRILQRSNFEVIIIICHTLERKPEFCHNQDFKQEKRLYIHNIYIFILIYSSYLFICIYSMQDHLKMHGVGEEAVFHCWDCDTAMAWPLMFFHLNEIHSTENPW